MSVCGIMPGVYCKCGWESRHLARDIRSCCLLFDRRDRRVSVASVALSATSCERKLTHLICPHTDRQPPPSLFFTQVSRNIYSSCHRKGVVTNSFTHLIASVCSPPFSAFRHMPTHSCKQILLDDCLFTPVFVLFFPQKNQFLSTITLVDW